MFVYYDADEYPRLILNPWGLVLTPTNPTDSAAVGQQSRSPVIMGTATLLANNCGNKLASSPTVSSGKVRVTGNFTAVVDDSTFRCTVSIGATYFDSTAKQQKTDTARLLVTLAKPSADAITPSQRDLNILATAGGSSTDSSDHRVEQPGTNSIAVKRSDLCRRQHAPGIRPVPRRFCRRQRSLEQQSDVETRTPSPCASILRTNRHRYARRRSGFTPPALRTSPFP